MKIDPCIARVQDNTYQALELLFENSCLMQDYFNKTKTNGGISDYKEFCTVKLCSSRRSGHSSALVKLALKYFKSALFMTPNFEMAKRLNILVSNKSLVKRQTVTEMESEDGDHYYFTSFSEKIKFDHIKGIKLDAILIDCASFLSSSMEEKIYRELSVTMSCNDRKFFIFVE